MSSEIIEIIEPSKKVFDLSESVQKKIKKVLPEAKTRLIGSFAVPLCGKKEIDILIEVGDVEQAQEILMKEGFNKGPNIKEEGFCNLKIDGIECDLHILPVGHKKIRQVYDKVTNALKEDANLRERLANLKRSLNGKTKEEYKKEKSKFYEETIFADWLKKKEAKKKLSL